MTELIYKSIKGYENLYLISNTGIVYSQISGKELSPRIRSGYHAVDLYRNGTRKTHKIHRLIAEAFIENPENKPFVDHIDRNRLNNNINNLRWVSSAENSQNRSKRLDNTSGVIGICETSKNNGENLYYQAQIMANGKQYQKLFPRTETGLQEATIWYLQMKHEYHIN